MKISLNKAAVLAKRSKTRLLDDLKSGVLSGTQDQETKYWMIDVSELQRVYGDLKPVFDKPDKTSKTTDEKPVTVQAKADEKDENQYKTSLLEFISIERDNLLKTIEDLRSRLDKSEEKLEVVLKDNSKLNTQLLLTHDMNKQVAKKGFAWIWVVIGVLVVLGGYLIYLKTDHFVI